MATPTQVESARRLLERVQAAAEIGEGNGALQRRLGCGRAEARSELRRLGAGDERAASAGVAAQVRRDADGEADPDATWD
ncbi:hypothetical protein AB0F15_36520 [Amycolatopsis sp. NPDC026612]|uniref:hypothetical protein n=1 Tax=Amycolatopsis sp. NPDC026612 TaxID=3155466 RepID=UPI00340DEF6D